MDGLRPKERVGALAGKQAGRVTRAQLLQLGLTDDMVDGWFKAGYLTRVLPKVYAVGHTAPSRAGDLWAAVLYAGPGAMLSHATAAHHRGLINHPPRVIEVSTPRDIRSTEHSLRVYGSRDLERVVHDRIPCTTSARTVLDLAAIGNRKLVRRALSVLDFRKELDVAALESLCGRGKPGSKALRRALAHHQPELARVNGTFEERFLYWCERSNVPMPRFNAWVHGVQVDAYWPDYGLVVELDGHDNHSSPAQLSDDRAKELVLRSHGLRVVRYGWALLEQQPVAMRADLLGQLAAAR